MAAITICSDFGTQENIICDYYHCFPIYFPYKWVGSLLNFYLTCTGEEVLGILDISLI